MNSITVTLPWPPAECSPNSRAHWAVRAKAVKEYKMLARAETRKIPDEQQAYIWAAYQKDEPIHVIYEFCPPDDRRRDFDNFVSRCKPYLDGICYVVGIDDSVLKFDGCDWGGTFPGGQVIITLEVIE